MLDNKGLTGRTPRCNDREAIRAVLKDGRPATFSINGNEIHIWWREPEPGAACDCGARKWS